MEVRQLRDKATEAFTKGRFSKAAELYEDYCKAEPKDFQARLRTGDAWAKAGQKDRAISAYQLAATGFAREGFLPRAIAASKLILELDPKHTGVQQMLADLYARKNAGGNGVPVRPAAPVRKVELPSFTEHMATSMGPAAAPLELPEEDEPASAAPQPIIPPAPQQVAAPAQHEEELAVVQGVMPVAPPGLAPRGTVRPSGSFAAIPAEPQKPPPPPPSVKPLEVAPPRASPAAAPDETALEFELGQGTKKVAWAAVSEPLISGSSPTGPSAPATPAPSGGAPPGLRPRRSNEAGLPELNTTASPGFTELEMEAGSLLNAVEQAAISGVKQRESQAGGVTTVQEEEDMILVLTEEVPSDAPAAGALPNIPLFSDLPQDAFIELFERCPLRRFSQGQLVFERGSHGNAFYVICEGSVHVFKQEGAQKKTVATMGSGAFFGEMALLSGAPRVASVESASEDTQLLEISAPVLAELSRRYPQVAQALKKFCRERMLSNVMNTSALFEPFARKERRTLVQKFRTRDVRKNEVVVRDGEQTDGLYVVLYGEVEVRKGDQVLSRLREGELFGEISLLSKTPATATVTATRRSSLLRLPREDFDALIFSHPQILVLVSELSEQRLRRTEALTGSQVFEMTAEDLLV